MGSTLNKYFTFKCFKGLEKRGFQNDQEYIERLNYEISVIHQMGYAGYFLIVQDFINWAKNNDIYVGPGRGSGAGSLSCYCLGITNLDPIKLKLIFERFLNPARLSMPDIDVDFEKRYRDRVINYITEKYGADRVAHIGTFNLQRAKAAVRNVTRTLGHPYSMGDEISKMLLEPIHGKPQKLETSIDKIKKLKQYFNNNGQEAEILKWAIKLEDIISSAGVHASGIVISNESLHDTVPLFLGRSGELTTQWEMKNIEQYGLIKFDFLGLDALNKIHRCIDLIKEKYNQDINIDNIDLDDPDVYKNLRQGNATGVFQLEASSGMRDLLVQIRPTRLEDLIALVAIYRPGPLGSTYKDTYLKIRAGTAEPEYLIPELEPILEPTSGWIIYQEQVLEIVKQLSGFTMAEADLLRRAIGKKETETLKQQEKGFKDGWVANGYPLDKADTIWEDIVAFSEYAFCKCVDGDTKLYRPTITKGRHYTVSELYKIKNDRGFARSINAIPMRNKLTSKGYGHAWSLNKDNKLVKNKIIDIRYQGVKETYQVTTESGLTISTTLNHKFPTSNGEKKLENISVEEDLLYINNGFKSKRCSGTRYRFNLPGDNFPKKGQQGFQKRDTPYTQLKYYQNNLKKTSCELCSSQMNLEVHHVDGDHGNNKLDNLQTLCSGCHKKAHYQMGRTKMGEAGLPTRLEKIVSIESVGEKEVYDIEMDAPNHTFTIDNGIVTSNSHAAAYAYITYQTAWLKTHYPREFMCAVMISESGNRDEMIKCIAECRRMGIQILPPDINESKNLFYVDEDGDIRFGLSPIKNLGESPVSIIMEERLNNPFSSFSDFCDRVDLGIINRLKIESLVKSGCFDSLGLNRASLLEVTNDIWEYRRLYKSYEKKMETFHRKLESYNQRLRDIEDGLKSDKGKSLKSFKCPASPEEPISPEINELPELTEKQLHVSEYELLGFYVSSHPLDGFDPDVYSSSMSGGDQRHRFRSIESIKEEDSKFSTNLGAVISNMKEITTKAKKQMAFFVLEDLTGSIEAVCFPRFYNKYKHLISEGSPLAFHGNIEVTKTENEKISKFIIDKIKLLELRSTSSTNRARLDCPLENIKDLIGLLKKYKGDDIQLQISFLAKDGTKFNPLVSFKVNQNIKQLIYEMDKIKNEPQEKIKT